MFHPQPHPKDWLYSPGDFAVTERLLGSGAFGEVRVAKWRNIDVAFKTLHKSIDLNVIEENQLFSEIDVLSRLRHPNLVQFIGMCCSDSIADFAIVTELMPCSLYDIL